MRTLIELRRTTGIFVLSALLGVSVYANDPPRRMPPANCPVPAPNLTLALEKELREAGALHDGPKKPGFFKTIAQGFSGMFGGKPSMPVKNLILGDVPPLQIVEGYRSAQPRPIWSPDVPKFREIPIDTAPKDLIGKIVQIEEDLYVVQKEKRGKTIRIFGNPRDSSLYSKKEGTITYAAKIIGAVREKNGEFLYELVLADARDVPKQTYDLTGPQPGFMYPLYKDNIVSLKTLPVAVDQKTAVVSDRTYIFQNKDGTQKLTAKLKGWTNADANPVVEIENGGKLIILDKTEIDWSSVVATQPAPKSFKRPGAEQINGRLVDGVLWKN